MSLATGVSVPCTGASPGGSSGVRVEMGTLISAGRIGGGAAVAGAWLLPVGVWLGCGVSAGVRGVSPYTMVGVGAACCAGCGVVGVGQPL